MVVVCFRAVHRCCFLGSCSPLGKDSLVVELHCVGLQHFGEREGLLNGCFRLSQPVALCVLPMLQNGVSVLGSRWGVGGQPVLRSLSRLRLLLFEARLSGYCVRGGESRESTLGS